MCAQGRGGRAAEPELSTIARAIVGCARCPRLRSHCAAVAIAKRAAFREGSYWGRPVPGFGDPDAWLHIVGLAPAAHGANRTGRMFTGDRSGSWLYGELHRRGLASRPESISRDDGLTLEGVFVSAAARCAPPANRPTREELDRCREYLIREIRSLSGVRVRLALGRVAFDAVLKSRRALGAPELKRRPAFGHGRLARLPEGGVLVASYHPSQQNTSTGVLTQTMWRRVFGVALRHRPS